MKVVLRPEAVDDLRQALTHYADIDPELAGGFVDELDALIERLQMFPRSGRPVEQVNDVRRARLRRFPYGVFYRLNDEEIRILRVLHSARDRPALPEAES